MTQTSDIVTVIASVTGGGVLGSVIQSITSWRKGIREDDVAKDQTAIAGFKDLAESLRSEVDRLKTAREEDRARLDRIEHQITVERDLKWAAIRYIRRLHDWIALHMPGASPPVVPEELAPHVTTPRKDTS